jgi:hypothetical protein
MKTTLAVITCLFLFVNIFADDTKYVEAMKKNLVQIDSCRTANDFIETANSFLRIAEAEKDKWLPYYYVSFCKVLASFTDQDNTKKDAYLDQALVSLNKADSLKPKESEIYTLRGMLVQARLAVDPMSRYMQYGAEMNQCFDTAKQLNPKNPRPEYLEATTLLYTPVEFGGGQAVAKPMFESSLKKFNEFIPENELMPIWGKQEVESTLKRISQ